MSRAAAATPALHQAHGWAGDVQSHQRGTAVEVMVVALARILAEADAAKAEELAGGD